QPHRASTAPQHGDRNRPAASRASTPSAEPRTVITVVPPPAPSGGLPRNHGQRNTGRAAAITDMATVTPSSNPRTTNPPDHIKTTPSTTAPPCPWTSSTAADTAEPDHQPVRLTFWPVLPHGPYYLGACTC